ncbi:hypothetical protein ATZ33_14870 [Enterococcus silesiacus]|uniref:DUF1761 domain-containing protein n=1 Tax=Enterococcus silesiacus TaxID=332949 RepID=A0A0S3KED5_9ENTE|nr:DUF1761 domain-containing protein [Enterococcus silesiacus]ALS02610.1 hypothetical protein ATZ33_14870 [Enterococcus silesiacus]OJG93464.1 hypothetical protein RV15_GL000066 [Enterococcus silesiacus]
MTTGFYLAAISGAVFSFIVGCIWYTLLFGKTWQKEMVFSEAKIKTIFTPKKMFFAFVCEWMAAFCTVGLLFNLQVPLVAKTAMLATVIIFSGIKLSIFDGKSFKTILINEGYRLLSALILTLTFTIFM